MMKKLKDVTVNEFLDLLASEKPAPGGGSASAYAGAQGVGLFVMIANLTVGKPKYAEYEQVCRGAIEKGEKIRLALIENIDKDTEAYMVVSDAYKMPKDTEEQKKARSTEIAKAILFATEVPFEVMKLGMEGLRIAKTLVGKANPNAASDLGAAALCLLTCVKGGWLNVKINLSGIKDAERTEYFKEEALKILEEAQKMSDEIYDDILELL